MDIAADLKLAQEWASYAAGILSAVSKKPATAPTTPAQSSASNVGITLGVDPLPELTAAFNGISQVSKMFTQWDAENNTPAMVNASVAEKLQAFHDRVNQDLATGNEADLEKLES